MFKVIFRTFLIGLAGLFLARPTLAATQNRNLGLGVILGGPTALSGKYFFQRDKAIDAGLAFDFSNYALIYGDYLVHFPGLFKTSSEFINQLNPYVGVGPIFVFSTQSYHDQGPYFRNHSDSFALGVRIPVGVEWMAPKFPLGISLELAPGLTVIPATEGFIEGGLALRYYF